MAYNDALFQLGMDLTRSSPAQEEVSADLKHGDVPGDHTEDVHVATQKLVIDLNGAKIGSAKQVEKALADALGMIKTAAVKIDASRANARGWMNAGAELASGGHVTLDLCPSTGFVAVDVTSAGLRPETAMFAFAEAFGAREVMIKRGRSASELARIKPVVVMTHASKTRKASAPRTFRAKAA